MPMRHALAWIDAAAEEWLGWSLPPVSVAFRTAGWRPDRRGTWCLRCGATVGPAETTATGCGGCRDAPAPVDLVVRLGAHRGALREWILATKYQAWDEMGLALGRRLGRRVRRHVAPGAIVVPVPVPRLRMLRRGIDHGRVIAAGVGQGLGGAPVLAGLESRRAPTQVSLGATQRRRLRGRFAARGRRLEAVRGRWVVLVDDVWTTGTTIREARRILRPYRPEGVVAAVLAVRDAPDRRSAEPAGDDDFLPGTEADALTPLVGWV